MGDTRKSREKKARDQEQRQLEWELQSDLEAALGVEDDFTLEESDDDTGSTSED